MPGTIIENVNQARTDIAQAFQLLQQAHNRLKQTLGDGSANSCGHLWERDISDYNLGATATRVDKYQARNAWRYLISQTGIDAYMTEHRKEELQKQLEKGDFPELTLDNVLSTLAGLASSANGLLLESIKEVFDWLRPQRSHLKTNKKWQVGYKVIIGYLIDTNYGKGFHVSYGSEQRVRALGNVLSLLDGQGVFQYPNDLLTQLNTVIREVDSGALWILPYMQGRCFCNRNLHITFTRPDLIDRLNQLGTDGSVGKGE